MAAAWAAPGRSRPALPERPPTRIPPTHRQPDRGQHLLVPRAAAEVAGQGLPDLRVGGGGVAGEEVVGGDDQAGGAEAALDGAGFDERLLYRVEGVVGGQALDGGDLGALGLAGQDQAGADQDAVQVDRTRAALALLAGVLGAGQAEALAQHVQQALALPDVVGLAGLAVDRAGHAHRRQLLPLRYWSQDQARVRRASTSRAWTR